MFWPAGNVQDAKQMDEDQDHMQRQAKKQNLKASLRKCCRKESLLRTHKTFRTDGAQREKMDPM